jgi:hypothetical protein
MGVRDLITWSVAIDLDGDGDYTETNEELAEYVQNATWSLGFSQPYDNIARAATLSLQLKNSDRRFSPEYTGSPIYPNFTRGKSIKITTTYEGVTRTMFVGTIDSIVPVPGQKKERYVTVTSNGLFNRMQNAEVFIAAQEDKRADEVIAAILLASGLVSSDFSGRWRLGIAGESELGDTTELGAVDDILTAEQGISVFEIIGDQWSDGVSVYGALRDTVGQEGGRLFVDRSGVINFWNRHHMILDTASLAAFDDEMSSLDYAYGEDVINHVIVRANPRSIGTSEETLGEIDQAVRIKAGDSKNVSFRYASQSAGVKIAGKNALAPVQTTDFTANSQEDGSGADLTANVSAAIIEESATRSQVTFTNSGPLDAWLQPGATIRGIKITDFGEVDVEAEDSGSISTYDRQRYTYPYVMDTVDAAEGMANLILARGKNPAGIARSMQIYPYSNPGLMGQALNLSVGSRITVAETQTAADGDYFIIGEQWQLMKKWTAVTWMLEPASREQYWILGKIGFGELGQTTYLGPY